MYQSLPAYKRIFSIGIILFTLAITAVYLSRQIYDPDLFWHLKTGQWIWENKSLPHTDPFGIPPFLDSSPRNDFILTSYWLIQLILYGFYSLFGMSGIIVFRWVIAGICVTICAGWTNLRNSIVTAIVALGIIQILELYCIERPQFVSFVCFGALLINLFRFFEQDAERSLWRLLIPLSLLMMLWSNMHGGFVIGQAILIFCVVTEGIKFFHPSLLPLSAKEYRILLISSITALLASFINPNAINLIKYIPTIFDANNYGNLNISEELSIFEFYKSSKNDVVFFYITSMLLTVTALLSSKHRKNITLLGILAGAMFFGCLHMRLMPFFLVSATIFMSRYIETECSTLKVKVVAILMLAVTTFYCLSDEHAFMYKATKSGWVPEVHFPVNAADFIATNKISGNIYTTMNWGGYMIWRMGAENKMFYDGRILNLQRAWEYNNSLIVTLNQRSYWKGLFNMYDVRIVVLPIYVDGSQSVLAQSIFADNEWGMAFADQTEVVFVRKRMDSHAN